jgi:hypothetical protein
MAKDPVRWNSTKKKDVENARTREIKNIVFESTKPLVEEIASVKRAIGWLTTPTTPIATPRKMAEVVANRTDAVNHPNHYTMGGVEVIDAIEAWQLGFSLANVIKYVARSEHKGSRITDLEKARWYLDREISRLKKEKGEK